MSLYPRGNVWWSRIEVRKKVYQFSTRTTNKNKARSVEAAFRTEKEKGRDGLGLTAPTLSEFSTQFINSLPGRVAKQTYRFYVTHWMPLVNSDLGECRVDRIGPAEIEKFVQWRRRGKVSTTTVNHNLRCLRRSLHLAAEWNLIAKPPKIKLLPGEHQREYVLTDEAVTQFAAEPDLIGRLVPFLVDTGLRRREVCNLLWENVNLDEKWIFIPKGKTKAARRRIPLTNRAHKILTDLPRNGEYVFTFHDHGITPDWISHAFLDVRRKLKLPDECVLHSCRHTAATRAGKAGASPFTLQKLFGWSNIQIAMRYVHSDQQQLERVIASLNV